LLESAVSSLTKRRGKPGNSAILVQSDGRIFSAKTLEFEIYARFESEVSQNN
jgi:hypothetical protein